MIALEASQSSAPEDRDPRHGLIASQYFKFTSTLHSLECDGVSSPLIWLILHIVDSNKSLCCVGVYTYVCSRTLHAWIFLVCWWISISDCGVTDQKHQQLLNVRFWWQSVIKSGPKKTYFLNQFLTFFLELNMKTLLLAIWHERFLYLCGPVTRGKTGWAPDPLF